MNHLYNFLKDHIVNQVTIGNLLTIVIVIVFSAVTLGGTWTNIDSRLQRLENDQENYVRKDVMDEVIKRFDAYNDFVKTQMESQQNSLKRIEDRLNQ